MPDALVVTVTEVCVVPVLKLARLVPVMISSVTGVENAGPLAPRTATLMMV